VRPLSALFGSQKEDWYRDKRDSGIAAGGRGKGESIWVL